MNSISFRSRAPRSVRSGRKVVVASALAAAILGLVACTPAPKPKPPPTPLSVGCHDAVDIDMGDVRFDGPIDTYLNAAYMYSKNGSCSGPVEYYLITVIVASSVSQAVAKCAAIAPGTSALSMQLEWGVPEGNFSCSSDFDVPAVGCYDSATPGLPDIYLFNAIDEPNGLKMGLSTTGSCSQDGPLATMVYGVDAVEAAAKCTALAPGKTPSALAPDYAGVPPDFYACL